MLILTFVLYVNAKNFFVTYPERKFVGKMRYTESSFEVSKRVAVIGIIKAIQGTKAKVLSPVCEEI